MKPVTVRTPDPADPVTESHTVDVQWGIDPGRDWPDDGQIIDWVCRALDHIESPAAEVSVRLMSSEEMVALNQRYRDEPGATNVLSFPSDWQEESGRRFLGDLAVCVDVIRAEAVAQDKTCADHLAHMLVHGVLHLSGYDHLEDHQAQEMESAEVAILQSFGIGDPYRDRSRQEDGNQ